MPIFTITYDLRNQSQHDYQAFAQELKKQKCFQIMTNTCLGSFANNATQVHNHFRKLLDKGDSLLVAELHQHFAYTGRQTALKKWLELNPPAALPNADGAAKEAKPAGNGSKPAAKTAAAKAPAEKKAK